MNATLVRETAYGEPARVALCEAVEEAKRTSPLAPVTLVVPTNLCGVLARRALAQTSPNGRRGVAGLTVLTLDRLAELVASPALTASGRRPATRAVLAAAWRRALAEDPLLFAQVRDHPATVAALVEAHRRLRELTEKALGALAADRLQADLVTLHRRVVRALDRSWYDVRTLRDTAHDLLADGGTTLDRLGTLLLHLPQDLDPSASRLAAVLATGHVVRVVAGMTGVERADAGVRAAAAAISAVPAVATPTPAAAGGTPAPAEPATATAVLHASDSDDEVRCVVREVVAALRRVPANRLAVLYAATDPYARLLAAHFATAGVTINGPGVRPTADRLLPRAFLALLALPDERFGRASVMRLLSDGAVHRADGSSIPASRWDRLSREAGVVSGEDWDLRLRRYADEQRARARVEADAPEPLEWRINRSTDAATEAEHLRAFVAGLMSRLADGRQAQTWEELADWALDLFESVFADEKHRRRMPADEAAAGDRLEAALRSLRSLGTLEPNASLDLLRQVLEVELTEDVPRVGSYGTGVLVAPISSAIGLDADEVFVVGLAEGIYPTRQREDALLPDEARERSGGELPAVRERLDRQHRHLLAAFAAAPTVVASFPRGDLRGRGERLPSRWLLPTLRALTGDPSLAATEWDTRKAAGIRGSASYAASMASTEQPAHESEWRLRTVSAGLSRNLTVPDILAGDGVTLAGIELVRARRSDDFTRYDGNLTSFAGRLPDPSDASQMVSATKLESWTNCPHGYFVQRMLGVEPVEQPEELLTMTPADRGDLLHRALDGFFQWLQASDRIPGPDEPWTAAQRAQLRRIGEEIADDAERRGITGHPTIWERERRLILHDLDQLLTKDAEVRRAERRRQVRSELTFGRTRHGDYGGARPAPPVQVSLPDGRTLRFAGSADRIDVTDAGGIVVVDYKSGKADSFKGLTAQAPTLNGSKLQLPVYAYAARAALRKPRASVRAEYWFIGSRDRGERIGYDLTPEVAARYAETLAAIVDGIAGGVFPPNVPEDREWSPYVACSYCDPDGLGAKDRRIQWERKKAGPQLAGYVGLTAPGSEA